MLVPTMPTYTEEQEEALRAYARVRAPILPRWMEYPAPMRDEWRRAFGLPWAEVMARPLAHEVLPLLDQEPAPKPANGKPPERDVRPPDVPPQPRLPAAPARRVARPPERGGFLEALVGGVVG